jgi:iron complex transport system ATP-binding protein
MAEGETALETVATGKDAMIDRWGPLSGRERARARDILSRVGCAHLEKRVWAVLSQGERQRVLIGRALMAEPEALILDEPCAGLDPGARERFLEFVQELTSKGPCPAIIFVTHHVEEIVPGLTHILALKAGSVVAAGPKKEVLTSRLLSEVFDCRARLSGTGGRYALRIGSGSGRMM